MLRKVKTENGWVKGLPAADPRITSFKGIPFAAPPTGENRWRAPQPCPDWDGELEAYKFAPISVQDTPGLGTGLYDREWHVDPDIPIDEDCLYLNVWTNAKKGDEKMPVLVWYFGGGLQWGYPAEMEFDGERIARRGVVCVTVNYRLNVFGFLTHPDLTRDQPDAPANFGNLDQQAGLFWVKRNIEAFGGDPDNITIAGQSAGGGSVMNQITSPSNFGVIRRAIVQSGIFRSPYSINEGPMRSGSLEAAGQNGVKFLEFMGVSTIEEARKLDAFFIRQKYAEFAQSNPRFFTVCDNKFNFGDPYKLYAEGKHADIDIMAGNTKDEFMSTVYAADDAEFRERAKAIFGDKTEEFLTFPQAAVNNGKFYAPVRGIELAVKAMYELDPDQERKHYYYSFDIEMPGEDNPGSFHSCELWFFFETLAKCHRPFTGKYYDVARQMCNYYCNFIRTGDPNGKDIDGTEMPQWDAYDMNGSGGLRFTLDGAMPAEKDGDFERFLIEKIKNEVK